MIEMRQRLRVVDGYQEREREGRVAKGLGKSEDDIETGRRGQKKQAVRMEKTKDDLQKTFNVFKDREQVKCPLV